MKKLSSSTNWSWEEESAASQTRMSMAVITKRNGCTITALTGRIVPRTRRGARLESICLGNVLLQLRNLRFDQLRVRALGNIGKAVAQMGESAKIIGLPGQDHGEQLFAIARVVERVHGQQFVRAAFSRFDIPQLEV